MKRNPVKKNMDKLHKPITHTDKTKYNRTSDNWKMGLKICEGCEDTYLDIFETCPYCELGISKNDLKKMKRREWLDL